VTTGLVVMAYGTPRSPGEVEAYYTHIRRGRPPAPEQLADLVRRYEAIGGLSPLAARTADQVSAIEAWLGAEEPGGWRVTLGNKHAPPFVEDAVASLAGGGVESVVGLVLAPHYSGGSVGEYHARARKAAAEHGREYRGIDSWHDVPEWLDAQAARVAGALDGLGGPAGVHVLFTAHSLPERVLAGDAYADQLAASAAAIAARAGLPAAPTTESTEVAGDERTAGGWSLAWQSAGRTPEPWRGPDVLEVIDGIAAAGSAGGVLVCPQGFVSDHLEVLYDLDIDAARHAADRGLAFARTASVNDEPAVMGALAARVRKVGG
jgi:protoporphyrin/coproporphyrin ferrochelatase